MTEPIQSTFQEKIKGPGLLRSGAVAVAAVVLLVSAAAAIGASPPSSSGPGASTTPDPSRRPAAAPGEEAGPQWRHGRFGVGHLGRGLGLRGLGSISITAISGSDVSLETVNGWQRTITVTDAVTIRKDDEEIGIADLAVGDRVALRETRTDAGEFSVTDLVVLQPTATGRVSAKTASTITLERPDGSATTVHVDADTGYAIGEREDAGLDDITVGMVVVAVGTERDDGSLDADTVRAGLFRRGFDQLRPWLPGPGLPKDPDAGGTPDA